MFKDALVPVVSFKSPHALGAGKRFYAIGDVHGCLKELQQLSTLMMADIDAHKQQYDEITVLYLGDYIDRGINSKGVLDFILQQKEELAEQGVRTIYLRGNHEQGLLDALEDEKNLFYRIEPLAASYGVDGAFSRPKKEILRDLKEVLPSEHLNFLEQTTLMHKEDGYLFVHAGLNPQKVLQEQELEDILMIRDPFLLSDKDFGYKVVFGHSLFEEVRDYGNKIGVDTAAFSTGKLSCAVLHHTALQVLHT